MLDNTSRTTCPPLDVLVPQGRDEHMDFSGGVPDPSSDGHAPINFHAFAAASGGSFHAEIGTIKADRRAVLVLIPRRAERALEAAIALKNAGHLVLATWKECGVHQIESMLRSADHETAIGRMKDVVDGWIAASPAASLFLGAWEPRVRMHELPTPYPVDVDAWRNETAWKDRSGIFVGTREWKVPTRRHADAMRLAMILAKDHPGTRLTCIHTGGMCGRWRVWRMHRGQVDVRLLRPMSYRRYLECLGRARLVLQRDASGVPGQVAGDSLLAGVPCLGGDGMLDRLAFGHLPGAPDDESRVLECASRLLESEEAWSLAMAEARARAGESVAFNAFRVRWAELARSYAGAP